MTHGGGFMSQSADYRDDINILWADCSITFTNLHLMFASTIRPDLLYAFFSSAVWCCRGSSVDVSQYKKKMVWQQPNSYSMPDKKARHRPNPNMSLRPMSLSRPCHDNVCLNVYISDQFVFYYLFDISVRHDEWQPSHADNWVGGCMNGN